jgi:hypothetical protein
MLYLTALFLGALHMRKIITCLCGEIGYAILVFFFRISAVLTAYSVSVLSIQLCRVTVNPLLFRVCSQPAWRCTGVIICGVWILAALLAFPEARLAYLCNRSAMVWFPDYYKQHLLFQLLVSCIFPLCMIAFSYIMTARHLGKSSCYISEDTQNPHLNTRKFSKKFLLGLTVIFVISHVPGHIYDNYLISIQKYEDMINNWSDEVEWFVDTLETGIILNYFLSITSCLNPVALFCTSRAFRRHFKRYLTGCCKTKSPPNDFELIRRN